MSYIDPTQTGEPATDSYSTELSQNIGAGGAGASITHINIGGVDYIVLESTKNGIEIMTLDPDTCELTFFQNMPRESDEFATNDDIEWVTGSNDEIYGLDSSSDVIAGDYLNIMHFNPDTEMFEYSETNLQDYFGTLQKGLSSDVFQAADGNIYALVEDPNDSSSITKLLFDPATGDWSTVDTFTSTGVDPDFTRETDAPWDGYYNVVTDADGNQYIIATTDGGNQTTQDGVEIIKLDASGNPISSQFIGDADLPGSTGNILLQPFSELLKLEDFDPEFDANGNLVLVTSSHVNTTGGIAVIDPDTGEIIYAIEENGTDPLTGELLPTSDLSNSGDVTFSDDGRYMYVTSQTEAYTSNPTDGTHTVVIDTMYPDGSGGTTYAMVDVGTDTEAGLDEDTILPTNALQGAIETEIITITDADGNFVKNLQLDVTRTDGPTQPKSLIVTVAETLLGEEDPSFPCFTAGTLISTVRGEIAIEDIVVGDLVQTVDHGLQPVRWIGSTTRPAVGDLAPILFKVGALGNARDLRVSPQHRMLLTGWRAELMFGEDEVLVPAKALVNGKTIVSEPVGMVEYLHIMFASHEVIWAEGIPSESFLPGSVGLDGLADETREELFKLFPELELDVSSYGKSSRPGLSVKEGRSFQ